MIKAIVFDLDGMIYLTKEMFSERYAKEFGIDPEIIIPFFKNILGECQLGKKDLKEELEKVIEKWQWKGTVDELLNYWFDDGEVNEKMMELVSKLRVLGIKCGLCTNNEKYRFAYLKNKIGLDDNFDFIVTSFESGMKKPDSAIYNLVAKETGLKPEEIMICDDREKNVEFISSLGFLPYIYNDQDSFENKLKELQIIK